MGQIGRAVIAMGLAHQNRHAGQLHDGVIQAAGHLTGAAAIIELGFAIHQHGRGQVPCGRIEGSHGIVKIHPIARPQNLAHIRAGHGQVIDAVGVIAVKRGEHRQGLFAVACFRAAGHGQQLVQIPGIHIAILPVVHQLGPAVLHADNGDPRALGKGGEGFAGGGLICLHLGGAGNFCIEMIHFHGVGRGVHRIHHAGHINAMAQDIPRLAVVIHLHPVGIHGGDINFLARIHGFDDLAGLIHGHVDIGGAAVAVAFGGDAVIENGFLLGLGAGAQQRQQQRQGQKQFLVHAGPPCFILGDHSPKGERKTTNCIIYYSTLS